MVMVYDTMIMPCSVSSIEKFMQEIFTFASEEIVRFAGFEMDTFPLDEWVGRYLYIGDDAYVIEALW